VWWIRSAARCRTAGSQQCASKDKEGSFASTCVARVDSLSSLRQRTEPEWTQHLIAPVMARFPFLLNARNPRAPMLANRRFGFAVPAGAARTATGRPDSFALQLWGPAPRGLEQSLVVVTFTAVSSVRTPEYIAQLPPYLPTHPCNLLFFVLKVVSLPDTAPLPSVADTRQRLFYTR
jgi:hypothetical protein